MKAAEMTVLCWVAGLFLREMVRSSVTRETLRVETLLLHIKEEPTEVVLASGEDPGNMGGSWRRGRSGGN